MPRVEVPVGHNAFEFAEKGEYDPKHENARTLPEGHLAFKVQREIKEEKLKVQSPDFGLSEVEASQYPGGYFI